MESTEADHPGMTDAQYGYLQRLMASGRVSRDVEPAEAGVLFCPGCSKAAEHVWDSVCAKCSRPLHEKSAI